MPLAQALVELRVVVAGGDAVPPAELAELGAVVGDERRQLRVAGGVREGRQHRALRDVAQPDHGVADLAPAGGWCVVKLVPCLERSTGAAPRVDSATLEPCGGTGGVMDKGMLVVAAALALPAYAAAADGDVEAVKAVVKSAYVDGVHAKADAALMRAGFHPGFRMLVLKDGALTPVTLDEWAARIEKGAAEREGRAAGHPPRVHPRRRHRERRGRPAGAVPPGQAHLHRLPVALPLPRRLEDRVQDLSGASGQLAGESCRLVSRGPGARIPWSEPPHDHPDRADRQHPEAPPADRGGRDDGRHGPGAGPALRRGDPGHHRAVRGHRLAGHHRRRAAEVPQLLDVLRPRAAEHGPGRLQDPVRGRPRPPDAAADGRPVPLPDGTRTATWTWPCGTPTCR